MFCLAIIGNLTYALGILLQVVLFRLRLGARREEGKGAAP
jgi:hypothetical protein